MTVTREDIDRVVSDQQFLDEILTKLRCDSHELGELKATIAVNYGMPFNSSSEVFSGGRLAQVADTKKNATQMFVQVVEHLSQIPPITGVSIRRSGGEDDPKAEAIIELHRGGEVTEIGRVRILDNFSEHWNVE